VLASSIFNCMEEILKYLGNSLYITDAHTEHLREDAEKLGLDADRICRETDASRLMEGIYIKVEENGELHHMAANGLLAPDFSIKMLCLLCKADMLGRKCTDQQELLDKITLCEELAREEECYETCYPFPSSYTQRAFLAGRDVWKEQELYDDTWGEVILMSGLPGTGKDTWIKNHHPDLPVISLDDIRRANKIPATAEQGLVANLAREQAKEYLRKHQPFVWNATNITTQMRESLVSLFETYHVHVRVVYLETDWQTLLERNHSREDIVPQPVIEKMLGKMMLPEAYEASIVEWFSV